MMSIIKYSTNTINLFKIYCYLKRCQNYSPLTEFFALAHTWSRVDSLSLIFALGSAPCSSSSATWFVIRFCTASCNGERSLLCLYRHMQRCLIPSVANLWRSAMVYQKLDYFREAPFHSNVQRRIPAPCEAVRRCGRVYVDDAVLEDGLDSDLRTLPACDVEGREPFLIHRVHRARTGRVPQVST